MFATGDAQSIDALGSGTEASVQQVGRETSGLETKAHTDEDKKASSDVSMADRPTVQEATSLIDGTLTVLSVSSHSETSPVLGGRELVDGIFESQRSTLSHKSGETNFVVSFGSTGSPTTQVSPLDPYEQVIVNVLVSSDCIIEGSVASVWRTRTS